MTGDAGRRSDGADEQLLEQIDPDLNIFALANGLDLYRDRSDRPDRVLEWYRDGLLRRVRIVAVEADRLDVHFGAARRLTGDGPHGWWPLEEGLPGEELASSFRSLLAEAVARANDVTRDDLDRG